MTKIMSPMIDFLRLILIVGVTKLATNGTKMFSEAIKTHIYG